MEKSLLNSIKYNARCAAGIERIRELTTGYKKRYKKYIPIELLEVVLEAIDSKEED